MSFIISGFSDEISPNVDVQFNVLQKLNIKHFEVRGVDGKNISKLTDDEVTELKCKMDKYEIKVSSIGSPIGKININDDFKPHFDAYKRVVEIAKALDCKFIRMFSFFNNDEWDDNSRTQVFSRIRKMLDYAIEQDIVLLHENEKDIYGDTVERCVDLMDEFYCDNFKAVFDPANFVQCNQDTKKAFDALKDKIAYMHIKDALVKDGVVVPAGKGDGNIEYILKELYEMGFEGFASLEPHMGSFVGLKDLEIGDDMLKLPEGGEGTFTLAYNALVKILNNIY